LIEKMSHPCYTDKDALLQAWLLSQKGVVHDSAGHIGSDEEMHDEKEVDEREDAEESDDGDMDDDAWDDHVTAMCKGGYMMSL
jgi:hypothetical protein